jgi:glyoxylase-like metal-dependent hydrolase (beta-lactamase superfamily II)
MFERVTLSAFNPGPMTGDGNNTYLLVGSDARGVLIDAGVGDARHIDAIRSALNARHASLSDVLVTHAHGDHIAGVPALAREFPDARFRKYLWPDHDARYPAAWLSINDGESIQVGDDRLIAVFTPGHAPDHIAFWHEGSRAAFTGDLVVSGTTVLIAASKGGSLREYLASLDRIRALDAQQLLPAHGPAIGNPANILTHYVEHRARREAQILAALRSGHDTVQAIVETIYHGLPHALMPAATENVRAHLAKLGDEGRAATDGDRWFLLS